MFSSKKPSEDSIRAALDSVIDPETGKSITAQGMVSDVALNKGRVTFAIEVDPARGAAMEPLRRAAEEAVAKVKGVESVTAVLTAERPAPKKLPMAAQGSHGGPQAGKQPRPQIAPPGVRHIIAVASGKGGVGKSTVAANIACGLAKLGMSVGLLDADIYGPSVPRLLGVADQKPEANDDQKLVPIDAQGLKVMSIGFLVDEATPMVWRGPMVQSALVQMLRDVAWDDLDVLVIDMPPGTGDAQLTLAQQVKLAGAVIVSTPQDIALLDARKGIAMFEKVSVPVLGVVENMSYHVCSECGHREDIFGHGGARAEAEKLKVPFLGEIPLHITVRENSDNGVPIAAVEPNGEQGAAFIAVAEGVKEALAALDQSARPAPKIVVE